MKDVHYAEVIAGKIRYLVVFTEPTVLRVHKPGASSFFPISQEKALNYVPMEELHSMTKRAARCDFAECQI